MLALFPSILTPMGKPLPLEVRLAKAPPFRRALGQQSLPISLCPLQRPSVHHACIVREGHPIPSETAPSELCSSIQETAIWRVEGFQALTSRRWIPLRPSSNRLLCG